MTRASLPPARLLAVVVPVSVIGIGAYLAATAWFVHSQPSITTLIGVTAFFAASTLAERFPVPVEGADANGVSLGFVFAVAALVLFGWAAGTFVYVSAPTVTALLERKPLIRTVYNAGVFGIVGTLAGSILHLVHGTGPAAVLLEVALTATVLYAANLLLVTAAISASGSELGYGRLIRSNVHWTVLPFALMASTALMLVVLWQRTPYLFAALAGPLAAISLYQRSAHRALSAVRLSLTDPLTGLGNHRHFHERFEEAIAAAREQGTTLSLCLLDLDDFKTINDQYGHPAGDGVLVEGRDATALRRRGVPPRRRRVRAAPPRDRGAARAGGGTVDRDAPRRSRRQPRRRPDGERRRRNVPAARPRPRHPDPDGRRGALLGEGTGKESGASGTRRRRPRGPPGGGAVGDQAARIRAAASPRPRRRRPSRRLGQPLRARRAVRGPHRRAARSSRHAGRADPPGGQPARPRASSRSPRSCCASRRR